MSYASKLMDSAKKNSFPAKADAKATETEVEAQIATEETSVEESPAPEAEVIAQPEEDIEALKKRTQESLEDEVKKLRQENAKRREREKKALEEASKLFASERDQYEAQMAEMKQQLAELAKLKETKVENEVEKSIEVKAKESEIKSIQEANAELKRQLDQLAKAQKEREEKEAEEKNLREKAVMARFNEELKSIPEDKHKFAKSIFNGAEGDVQEKLFTFLEAKKDGIFGKKQIQVLHKPAATQSTNKTDNNQEKLTSKQKIKSGLAKSLMGGLQPGKSLRTK